MEDQENTTDKPQEGTWDSIEGYPEKITFDVDKPVLVLFGKDFEEPTEMPSQDGKGVYYLFNVKNGEGKDCSFASSAWTLLKSLKTHEPLAGKSLIITKKLVKGRQMYYVSKPDNYGSPDVKSEETKPKIVLTEKAQEPKPEESGTSRIEDY